VSNIHSMMQPITNSILLFLQKQERTSGRDQARRVSILLLLAVVSLILTFHSDAWESQAVLESLAYHDACTRDFLVHVIINRLALVVNLTLLLTSLCQLDNI